MITCFENKACNECKKIKHVMSVKNIAKKSSQKNYRCVAIGSQCTGQTYFKTFSLFKNDFFTEHHLALITDFIYWRAIIKLRCSSRALEIERGRYQNHKVPRDLHLCLMCKVVEDEKNFVAKCSINQAEWRLFYSKISKISCKAPHFSTLSDNEKCVYLLTNNDPQILTWFGKFVLSWVTVMGTWTVWSYVSMHTLEWSF